MSFVSPERSVIFLEREEASPPRKNYDLHAVVSKVELRPFGDFNRQIALSPLRTSARSSTMSEKLFDVNLFDTPYHQEDESLLFFKKRTPRSSSFHLQESPQTRDEVTFPTVPCESCDISLSFKDPVEPLSVGEQVSDIVYPLETSHVSNEGNNSKKIYDPISQSSNKFIEPVSSATDLEPSRRNSKKNTFAAPPVSPPKQWTKDVQNFFQYIDSRPLQMETEVV